MLGKVDSCVVKLETGSGNSKGHKSVVTICVIVCSEVNLELGEDFLVVYMSCQCLCFSCCCS